jgi:hypothetical protein
MTYQQSPARLLLFPRFVEACSGLIYLHAIHQIAILLLRKSAVFADVTLLVLVTAYIVYSGDKLLDDSYASCMIFGKRIIVLGGPDMSVETASQSSKKIPSLFKVGGGLTTDTVSRFLPHLFGGAYSLS